jgi:probable rRNA maturation factor
VEEDQGSDSSSSGQPRAAVGNINNDNLVSVRTTLKGRRLYLGRLGRLAYRILAEHNVTGGELSILIAGDAKLRRLNRVYRNIDRPTDVLAFPQDPPYGPASGCRLLGDVVISADKALRQARATDRPLRDELMLLLTHGVLHLIGYDHHNRCDAARMREAEQTALNTEQKEYLRTKRHQP